MDNLTNYAKLKKAIDNNDIYTVNYYLDQYNNKYDIDKLYKYLIKVDNYKYFEIIIELFGITNTNYFQILCETLSSNNNKFFIKVITLIKRTNYLNNDIIRIIIYEAAKLNNSFVVKYFVDYYRYIDMSDIINSFVLHNDLNMIKFIIENNGLCNEYTLCSPFINSIKLDYINIVKYFVESAKFDYTYGNHYVLEVAGENNCIQSILYLVEIGSDVNNIKNIKVKQYINLLLRTNKIKKIYETTTDL